MKKVLIYSPYSEWYLHSYYDITVAQGLIGRGSQVKVVCCDGTFSDCDQHWAACAPRTEQSCSNCMGMSKSIYNKSGLKFDWLGSFLIEKDFNDIKKWVDSLSIDDLLLAKIDGNPLGKWVSSSVNSHFRIKDLTFLDKTIKDGFRSYLYSGGLAYKAAKRIINDFQPDALFTFNGRMFSHRIFLEVARLNNVRVLTHERGRQDNSISLFQNESCSSNDTFASTWGKWQTVPLLENQLNAVDKIMFEDREQGKNTGWLSFVSGNDSIAAIKDKYNIPLDKKIVNLFPSSDDELAASDSWKPVMGQIEWIRQVVGIFLKRKEFVLIVRLHPNLSGHTGTNQQFLDEMKSIETSINTSKNVVFIWPKDKVNSYELLGASVANLTFFSTITLESVIRKKPVLICGGGPFYGLDCVASLKHPELLEESINSILESKVTKKQLCALYRFCYHYFFRMAVNFSLVEIVNVHHAKLTYTSVEELQEGKNKSLDSICDFLAKGNDVHLPPSLDKSNVYEENHENTFLENKMNSNSRMKSAGHCISVVVTCYNYAKYLKESVESIVRQTYSDFEIIIVNDGSTDNSQKIAELLINENPDIKIKLINQENSGQPAISRNNGIKQAVGEYILCVDADDKLDKIMLERCAQVLDANPSIDIAYTDRLDFDGVDEVVLAGEYNFNQLKYANHISYCGLYRRKVWEDVGGYRENVRGCEDWDFWVAAGCCGHHGKRIPEPLFMYRRHDTGLFQHALANFEEKKAHIVLNNKSVYTTNDIKKVESIIANAATEKRANNLSGSSDGVLITVIVPTFNRPKLLVDAVNSILSQEYKNIQIVVVNDCGDDVKDIVDSLNYKGNISYILHNVNKGLSAARNTGLKNASGEIICYLDDDDLFLPNHIRSVVDALSFGDVNFVYTGAEYVQEELVNGERKVLARSRPYENIKYSKEYLHVQNFIPINTWAHKKNIIDIVGYFDENLTALEDWDFLLRVSRSCQIKKVDEVSVEVRQRQAADEHMSDRERGKFVDLFALVYSRYPVSSEEICQQRKKQIACLEKQNEALNEISATVENKTKKHSKVAVILHLYYCDLWDEFKQALLGISKVFDLYISIPKSNENDISGEILKAFPGANIYKLPNKGRDILPFLTIFKEIQPLGYKLILKLHTKKSAHLKGYQGVDAAGEKWRKTTLSSLVQWGKRVDDIFELFESNPSLGIFAPFDRLHVFNSADVNFQTINQLMPDIDVDTFDKKQFVYAGGSMFWFRPEAIEGILKLNFTSDDFEDESGQIDGTVAHAIERLFGVVCKTSGYILTDRMPKRDDIAYQGWLEEKREHDLSRDLLFLSDNSIKPVIHCLIYIESEDLSLLANTIDSMGSQTYELWHLSIISTFPCPEEMFNEVAQLSWLQIDQQFDIQQLLLEIGVQADWIGFIEAGDYLESHALSSCVEYFNKHSEWQVVYTDEDKISPEGFFHSPQFKPDFNLDLLYSTDYLGGLTLFRIEFLGEMGVINYPNPFAAYDVVLHYLEYFGEAVIGHVENILMHRNDNLEQFFLAQLEFKEAALVSHFKRIKSNSLISNGLVEGSFVVKHQFKDEPKVSIIIPTKDQLSLLKACIDSILEKTSYLNYEVIIIDNQSVEEETKSYFDELSLSNPDNIRVIEYAKPYNFSAINNFAAKQAMGDYLVLLNNDTMVLQEEWLHGMLSQAQRSDVGIVGVKLVFPNKHIQHAGVVLGMGGNGVAEHPHIGISMGDAGYMNRAMVTQNVSAVTAACLMIEKKLYQQVGGLDEEKLKILYNDVDLCLKVREQGYKIVWTPYVTLIHHGSSSLKKVKQDKKKAEQSQQEVDNMLEKWLPQLANDPAYNRNLSLKTTDFQVDTSMNVTWNIDFKDKPRIYAFPTDSQGVGQYRVRGPLKALTQAGMVETSLANNLDQLVFPSPVEIERIKPDVLLIQNGFLDHMLAAWKRYRKFNDVFMVCGQDDVVYMLPDNHPRKGEWPKNIRRKVKEQFQLSDRLIVANEALAEEFKKMADEIVVVPNYLENKRWDSLILPESNKCKKLRVGWAGGQEHIGDLKFILPVVEALHKEVDWVFMGLCIEELRPYVKEIHHGVDFDFYPQRLADLNLDLAIAPLMHNKFNECKTNLRLLEYGVLGWPVVCSDVLPYQNAPVTRVANNALHWIKILRDKINEPEALSKEGRMLQQWVVDNYMLDNHADEWYAALMP